MSTSKKNIDNSYYECKRCFKKYYQKNDMKKHLNKQKKCIRTLESFKFNDDEIEENSLIRIYINGKKNTKIETTNNTLNNIMNNTPDDTDDEADIININNNKDIKNNEIYTSNNNISNNNINNLNISNINNIIDKNIINNIDKNIINNNVSININFNIVKDFKEDWDVSKIDDGLKHLLLNSSYKFTKTLENILENEVNLNVLIDNTTDSGFIFTENSLQKMDINDILKKSMEKIYNHLTQFRNDLSDETNQPNKIEMNDIAKDAMDLQMKEIKNKYDDYRRIKEKTNSVNDIIKNIYNNKKSKTVHEIDKSIKKIEGY